jgi:MSHA biogenesis protein MshG
MPQFTWTGRDARQVMRSGVIEANSSSQVEAELASLALVPVAIMPLPESPEQAARAARSGRRKAARIGVNDLLDMAKQMNTLMRAGVARTRAFTALSASIGHPGLTEVVEQMADKTGQGMPIWQAMAEHPRVFDRFTLAVVRRGEERGTLAEAFKTVYLHLEFHDFLKVQVRSARRLPLMLAGTLAIAAVIALGALLPWLVNLLLQDRFPLPAFSVAVLEAGAWVQQQGMVALALAGAGALAGLAALRLAPIRRHWDRLRLRDPLAGPTLRESALARTAGTLALGHRSGLPMPESLQLAATVCGNAHLSACILQVAALTERGEALSASCLRVGLFNDEAQQTLAAGEQQDQLQAALVDITQQYRSAGEHQHSRLLERVDLLLLIGLGVLALALVGALVPPLLAASPAQGAWLS